VTIFCGLVPDDVCIDDDNDALVFFVPHGFILCLFGFALRLGRFGNVLFECLQEKREKEG
jgi:hypothetical protein